MPKVFPKTRTKWGRSLKPVAKQMSETCLSVFCRRSLAVCKRYEVRYCKEEVLEIQTNSKTCPVFSVLLLRNAPAQDNYAAAWTQLVCFPCETLCWRIALGALTTTRGDGAVALSPLARHSLRVGWKRLVLLCFSCSLVGPRPSGRQSRCWLPAGPGSFRRGPCR